MNEWMYNEWIQFLLFACAASALMIVSCWIGDLWARRQDQQDDDEHARLHERDLK